MCNMELRFDLRFASRVAVARWPERSFVAIRGMFPGLGEIVSTSTYNNSSDESLIPPRYSRHFPIFPYSLKNRSTNFQCRSILLDPP